MKTDNNHIDLEQLLAILEHAGRDERRRQELGAMIDRMGGRQGHGAWWWVSRVAAAACILFFISTAVRIWFIPTGSGAPMVAEAEVPAVFPAAVDSTPAVTAVVAPAPRRSYVRPQVAVTEPATTEAPAVVEEYVAEEVEPVEPAEADTDTVPTYIILDDFAPDAELVVQTVESDPVAEPVAVAVEPAMPARRSIFSTLFRPAEPSMMEGTTLALLQF